MAGRVFKIKESHGEETGIEGYRLVEVKKLLWVISYETDDIKLSFGHSVRYFSSMKSDVEYIADKLKENDVGAVKRRMNIS